jgi:hypothetical protein
MDVGFEIQLQDEFGGKIDGIIDPTNRLPDLLPLDQECDSYPMLAGIDLYGDTYFNRLQIPRFLSELAGIVSKARTEEDRTLVSEIERLARRCAESVHTYVKFIGD